ncbi:aminotransferase class I/II-fold pyridoxal phosphate-dependent enzyme [Patescibacteria group bacterium]|nr:aminotransferase class I/II-fold pyridoxal phosphate-dependent enzyme [Patescibacteria group bacterium]
MSDDGQVTHKGAISQHVQSLSASGIRRFFDLLSNMEGIISLGVGEPDFVTPTNIRNAAVRSIEEGRTHYTSNYGLIELRQAISHHLERLYGVEYDPATEIIVTTGVSEALNLAMLAIIDRGDEVICSDPCYVAYQPAVLLAGGVFVPVPTSAAHDFRMLAQDVEERITSRTKAILLGYPSNPTGAVMERDDLLAVAELARRHDLFVIADEIYDRLVYGTEHICFSALAGMRDRTLLMGGFSKAYAMTGWRLAYACARVDLTEAMMRVHQYITMSAPTAAQYAALEALRNGEEDVRGMLAEYDRRRRMMVRELNAMGLTCFEPRGAFYCFPSVRVTGLSDEAFAEGLLMEEKVAVVPGSAFGQFGVGHVRICYAMPYEVLEQALERIRGFVDRHRTSAK